MPRARAPLACGAIAGPAGIPCARQALLHGLTHSTPTLHVAPSGNRGLRAFVTTDLPVGALVGSYDGRRLTPEQILAKDWDYQVVLFSISNGNTTDRGRRGNKTRHINRSCLPNCEAAEEHALVGEWR
jgi:uncharacterized protein